MKACRQSGSYIAEVQQFNLTPENAQGANLENCNTCHKHVSKASNIVIICIFSQILER